MRIIIEDFFSQALGTMQRIFIGLPQDYDAQKSYPVLYMHDGHNIFDLRKRAVRDWAVNRLFEKHHLNWILVAVESPKDQIARFNLYYPWAVTGVNRYLPSQDFTHGQTVGGNADSYIQFLTTELMPYIEKNWNTSGKRGIAGASLGGILSLYTAIKTRLFPIVGVLSPAYWFDYERFLDYAKTSHYPEMHLYISIGTQEFSDPELATFPQVYLQQAKELADVCMEHVSSLVFEIIDGGAHDAHNWHKAMEKFIQGYLVES